MRTSFLCLLPLLCALPALCERYHVHSDDPGSFIVSTGNEKPGDLVKTVPKIHDGFPPHSIVDINPPISSTQPTEGIVSGKGGKLFIGINKAGDRLEWQSEPYKWEFNPGTVHPFHVITIPNKSKIWFDYVHNKGVVEVVNAPLEIGPGDAFWRFDKA